MPFTISKLDRDTGVLQIAVALNLTYKYYTAETHYMFVINLLL